MKQPPDRDPFANTGDKRDKLHDIPTVDDAFATEEDLMDDADLSIPILTDIAGETPEADAAASATATETAPAISLFELAGGDAAETAPGHDDPSPPTEQALLFPDLPPPCSPQAEMLERMVDDLVAAYLPRLKHELRARLYDYLGSLQDPDQPGD